MAAWRFLDYVTADGQNFMSSWYSEQELGVQAAFDGALATLGATEDWIEPPLDEFKVLTGRHAGLCEIRFDIEVFDSVRRKFAKRRFRPVGLWIPENHEFILILGSEKSGRMYTPTNAFDLALDHKARLERGEGSVRDHF